MAFADQILDFINIAARGSALALTDGEVASENEAAFEFGPERFIAGLPQLQANGPSSSRSTR
ncbi:hypothetical protein ASC66_09900 [Leifsonia sp. Root4]|nr:hypothetical protein ASC66_09900 [Leifsonia sp. Root4]